MTGSGKSLHGLLLLLFSITALTAFLWLGGGDAMGEEDFVRRSIRARGMGNAFTAVANDEYALFYNPAGLQSVPVHIFDIGSIEGVANEQLINMISGLMSSANSEEMVETFSEVAGKKYYAEGTLSGLSITGPGWGYSLFALAISDIAVDNPTVPYFDVRTFFQAGATYGLAYSFWDYQLDLGGAFKVINRTGIDQTYHLVDFAPLINGDFSDLEDDFASETVFAPDFGAIYHYDRYHAFPLKFGVVAKNIGGLDFGAAGSIPMTIDTGVASELEFAGFDIILAADQIDLLGAQEGDKSFIQDLKLGAEAGLFKLFNGHHLVSARIGRNGVYNSYGFTINIFGGKLDYALWSEEIGPSPGDVEDKRQALKISLTF